MIVLDSIDGARDLLQRPFAIIFKHSTTCPTSSWARGEIERFLSANPGAEVHMIDVLRDRAVSQFVAERTGVGHASPQVIVWAEGRVVWNASHYKVEAGALEANAAPGR